MESRERNVGIDLLRSVAMFMVAVLHVLGQGGILKAAEDSPGQFYAAWFLEIAAYCAVNCYALISGYVGLYSKHRYSSLAELWLRVVYYTVIFTIVFKLLLPDYITPSYFIKAFMPVSTGQYWYFSAYFLMFLFLPLIKPGLRTLSKKQIQFTLASIILLLTVTAPSVSIFLEESKRDVFLINSGFSMLWLLVLYILGAYIRRFDAFKNIGKLKSAVGYLSMVLLTWGAKYLSDMIEAVNKDHELLLNVTAALLKRTVSYRSPTIALSGLFLFLFFINLKLPDFMKRLATFFAPVSFSVYLIHTNPLIWKTFMNKTFVSFSAFPVPKLIIAVLGSALAIFIGCALADKIRDAVFRKLKVKNHLVALENKFLSKLRQEEAETTNERFKSES